MRRAVAKAAMVQLMSVNDEEDPAVSPEAEDRSDSWLELDAAVDRDEGPFDFDEVDLDADDVKRLDLGSLIITPFPGMKIQLQVNKNTEQVQAVLVADGASALEVAVFAGPRRTSMLPQIREDILKAAEREGGAAAVVAGPFGAEIRRRLPVKDKDGKTAVHVSRTWLVSGPGWVLRGILMGKAALQPEDEDAELTLFEFFSNAVVRRGEEAAAPGSLLRMSVPNSEE